MNENYKKFGRVYPSTPSPDYHIIDTHLRFITDDTGLCTSIHEPINPNKDLDPASFNIENQLANGQKLSSIPIKDPSGVLGADYINSQISNIID